MMTQYFHFQQTRTFAFMIGVMMQLLAPLSSFLEILGLNLSWNTSFPNQSFSWFSSLPLRKIGLLPSFSFFTQLTSKYRFSSMASYSHSSWKAVFNGSPQTYRHTDIPRSTDLSMSGEETSSVCLNFPPAYKYRNYVENRLK